VVKARIIVKNAPFRQIFVDKYCEQNLGTGIF